MEKRKVTMQFIKNCTIRQDNTGEPIYEFTDTQMGNFLDSLELKSDLLHNVSNSTLCKCESEPHKVEEIVNTCSKCGKQIKDVC